MKIGILGTGNIGKTLVTRLSQAGHEVKVANSRGPESIDPELLSSGARAVTTAEALEDVEVVFLSIPLNRISGIAPLITGLPDEAVEIDASNY
jgi:predicted dinucleotide-binding enzyme